jgi:GxxExxY protein
LEKRGLFVLCEVPIRLVYEGEDLGIGYRADMIVNDKVILELKSVEKVHPIHKKQLLTYLRVADV